MKVQDLHSHLQRNGLGSLYMVVGEEPYFRDLALSFLRQSLAGAGNRDSKDSESSGVLMNCDLLYGDETDASEILCMAEEVSFFSSTRMIIVKWAEKLSARDGEMLIPYFQQPNESTTLVFSAIKLDGRTKWVQELKKRATVIDCAPLYENQRSAWVAQQARECGVKLDSSGLDLLKDQAAEGLYAARNELEKLGAFMQDGQPVGAQDVETVRGKPPGISVFDWSDAVASGDHNRALDIIAKNLETGEAPLRMVGAFLWQLRRLWKVKTALDEGKDAGQAVRMAGIPPFRAKDFVDQVQRWQEPQFRLAWELFGKADSALKGGKANAPKLVLDDLVLQLCQASARPAHTANKKTPPSSFSGKGRG
ncbi:MAG: DNA polymerase III subunit delta [Nitrospirales bacterium]